MARGKRGATPHRGPEAGQLIIRAQESGDPTGLAHAVKLLEEALAATARDDHELRSAHLANLAAAHQVRFQLTGVPDDLRRAIDLGRQAVAECPAGNPAKPMLLANLAESLRVRSRDGGDDLAEAISYAEQALSALPKNSPQRLTVVNDLALALLDRFRRTGAVGELDRAETLLSGVLSGPEARGAWSTYATVQLERHRLTGNLDDLDAAVAAQRRALKNAKGRRAAEYRASLALLLLHRHNATSLRTDLVAAVQLGQRAVSDTPLGNPSRPEYLTLLSQLQHADYVATRRVAQLRDAVDSISEAVRTTPDDDHQRAHRLATAARLTAAAARRGMRDVDLDAAINAATEAVSTMQFATDDLSAIQGALADANLDRFEITGSPDHLDIAIASAREALAARETDHPSHLATLGQLLMTRAEVAGRVEDAEEAVHVLRDVVATAPPGHIDAHVYVIRLGNALHTMFDHTGEVEYLEEAVRTHRRAIEMTGEGHHSYRNCLNNLAYALHVLSQQDNNIELVHESVAVATSAAAITGEDDELWPILVGTLAVALTRRWQHNGDAEGADDALAACERTLLSPQTNERDRHRLTYIVGELRTARFQLTEDPAELSLAITTLRTAVDTAPAGRASAHQALMNLAVSLHMRHRLTGDSADRDEAVTLAREACDAVPLCHAHRDAYLHNLNMVTSTPQKRRRGLLAMFRRTRR